MPQNLLEIYAFQYKNCGYVANIFCTVQILNKNSMGEFKLSLIQCDEACHYQKDGFCSLEHFTTVNSVESNCPHFKPNSLNQINSFLKTSDSAKL